MRALLAALGGLVAGLGGGAWGVSLAIPAPAPTPGYVAKVEAAGAAFFAHPPQAMCRSMADVEASGAWHLLVVDAQFVFGAQFAPVQRLILSNVDGRLVLGAVFADGCVGHPVVIAEDVTGVETGARSTVQ